MKQTALPRVFAPKIWFPLTVLVLAVGLLILFLSQAPPERTSSDEISSPRVGFAAPDFRLGTLDGETIRLSDLRGQPVVVNLWASWCSPCKAEMPALQRVYQDSGAGELQILAVNMSSQDSIQAVQDFVTENGLQFPVPLDERGEVARLYQMQALPSTYFIDSQGIIQQVIFGGPMSEATIRASVQALLTGDS